MNSIKITHIYQFINSVNAIGDLGKLIQLKDKYKKLIYFCLRSLSHPKIFHSLKALYPYKKFRHLTHKILYKLYERRTRCDKRFNFLSRALINELTFAKTSNFSSLKQKKIHRTNFTIEGVSVSKVPLIDEIIVNPLRSCSFVPMWGTTFFQNKIFQNKTFKDCLFDFINFQGSSFTDCRFKSCSFKGTVFLQTQISAVSFSDCRFEDVFFDDSTFHRVSFKKCHLQFVSLENIKQHQLSFSHNQSEWLFGLERPLPSGPPTFIIPWNAQKPGLSCITVNEVLKSMDTIPLKFNYLQSTIQIELLKKEVLDLVSIAPDHSLQSIPQFILQQASLYPSLYAEIYKIQNYTKNLLNSFSPSGVILTGGADVEPLFYGQARSKLTRTEPDFRRSVFEFCLIEEAIAQKLPLLGLCRGSQIGNIYFGGSLIQHIPSQKNIIQKYVFQSKSLTRKLLNRKGVKGVSLHHQAHDQIGKSLKVVSSYQGIPKVLESKIPTPPIILLQFHAEFTPKTHRLFKEFIALAKKN